MGVVVALVGGFWWSVGVPDDSSVEDSSGGVGGVDVAVVEAAEQAGVVQVGGPAVFPRDEVVGVGPADRCGAAGPGAAAVAFGQGDALLGGEVAQGPADVQGVAAGVDQHRDDLGAAQHPGEQVAGDRGAVVELGRWGVGCTPVVVGLGGGTQRALGRLLARARLTSAAGHTATRPRRLGCCGGEALGGHADDHSGRAAVGGRDVVPGQGGLGEVLQGVVAALAGGAWVEGAVLGR